MIGPFYLFHGGELERLEVAPHPMSMAGIGFVKTVECFGEHVVAAVTNTPNEGSTSASRSLGIEMRCTGLSHMNETSIINARGPCIFEKSLKTNYWLIRQPKNY